MVQNFGKTRETARVIRHKLIKNNHFFEHAKSVFGNLLPNSFVMCDYVRLYVVFFFTVFAKHHNILCLLFYRHKRT